MNKQTRTASTALLAAAVSALLPLVLSAVPASAAVGLWEFEENSPGTSINANGTMLLDTSGNGHDFTQTGTFPGNLTWDGDVPPGATPGSTSIATTGFYDAIATAATDDFSIGKEGALQISLWYKPRDPLSSFEYIIEYDTGNAPNSWGLYQDFPSSSEWALTFAFLDDAGGSHTMTTAPTTYNNSSAGWLLIELDINTFSGNAEFKVNGSVEDTETGLDGFTWGTTSLPLILGSDHNFGNGTDGNIDTLQITANFVPEPSVIGLGLIGAAMFSALRRRGTEESDESLSTSAKE